MNKKNNEFNVTGLVLFIGQAIRYKENLEKKAIVLEFFADNRFTQQVMFEFVNNNIGLIKNAKVGERVAIDFQLRGREQKSPDGTIRWFNSLEGISYTIL